MTKERLEQALEVIYKYKYVYSDVAYTIVENILTEWVESFDSYETHLDEVVHQEIETAFIFYKDIYDYLEKARIWDIEEALSNGFGNNLGDIAYYFLDGEVYTLLSNLDIY